MRKTIFILFFALLGVLSARAYDFLATGIYYNIISGTDRVEVTYGHGFNSYSGSVNIPATVTYNGTTYSVTYIGYRAFYDCSGLISVTIPESIDTIGYEAFARCSGLTSITIPNSVTTIGGYAFSKCTRLTSVTIPESVTYIGYRAFYDCTSIRSPLYNNKVFVYMPQNYSGAYAIPSGIQSIAGGAFYECKYLTSVTIPESVTSIGDYAFENCSGLTSVTIPESVDTIGAGAFYGTSISAPLYNSKVFAYMPKNYSGEYAIPSSIQLIAGVAFYECSGLTSVTIPNSVTSIGEYAFSKCTGLTSVTIPEGVTSIGSAAFTNCSGLTSVEWNAVAYQDFEYDDDYYNPSYPPFNDCKNITSITFGEQVEHIPAYLCYGMNKLTSVTIPESVTTIGYQAFYGCTSIRSPLYNSKVFAYMPQNYSSEYVIPSGIQSIAGGAFYGCSDLISVTIPNSVTSIGEYAFSMCTGLTSVTSLARKPPYVEWWEGASFAFSNYSSATLYVPHGCKAVYQSERVWRMFSRIEELPFDPSDPDDTPTPNEDSETDNFRVYAQGRTILLSEDRGTVQVYNMAGQCVYNGHTTTIPVPQSGVYIVAIGSQRFKVLVR